MNLDFPQIRKYGADGWVDRKLRNRFILRLCFVVPFYAVALTAWGSFKPDNMPLLYVIISILTILTLVFICMSAWFIHVKRDLKRRRAGVRICRDCVFCTNSVCCHRRDDQFTPHPVTGEIKKLSCEFERTTPNCRCGPDAIYWSCRPLDFQ